MTDATALLIALRDLGVELTAEGGDLCYDAPAGVLTPDLLAAMTRHKGELLALLAPPPPADPAELDWTWPLDPTLKLIGLDVFDSCPQEPWRAPHQEQRP